MTNKEIAVQLTCSVIQGSQLNLDENTAAQVVNFFKLVCAELEGEKKPVNAKEVKSNVAALRNM